MILPASIFWDFNLPNSTTWFYFSFLLAVALFFKFGRGLCMRNWDTVTVFLLVPGLLLIQEAKQPNVERDRQKAVTQALIAAQVAGQGMLPVPPVMAAVPAQIPEAGMSPARLLRLGYLVLLLGSGYFFVRCMLDLVLEQRPALSPNLSVGGLAWLAGALFICLSAVAYRPDKTVSAASPAPVRTQAPSQAPPSTSPVGSESATLALVQGSELGWVKPTFAVACHLAVIMGLILIGVMHFQDISAGMAAATFYLLLPYTGQYVGQAHHVWPVALVVWALVAYRWPLASGILLGLASATAYFPTLLLPLWLSFYWGRGGKRFAFAAIATAVVSLGVLAIILGLTEDLADMVREALSLRAWQPWRDPGPEIEGFWTNIPWAYRIPIFIAYMAFVLVTSCWPYPKNLAHVIALSAAVLIGIQSWYANRGGEYVLWYLPLLVLLIFRPNLADRRPDVIRAETDWLSRAGRGLRNLISRWFKTAEPTTQVH